MIKNKKSYLLVFLLMGVFLLMFGCAEDDSPATPTESALQLDLISPSGVVPYKSTATYIWNARGGAGSYSYSYVFTGAAAVSTPNTSVTFQDLDAGAYTFAVTVTDGKGGTASANSATLTVLDLDSTAIQNPTVEITQSPLEGGDVAAGGSVTFSWSGADASPFGGLEGYMYKIENTTDGSYVKETTAMVMATTVTFDALTSGAYTFTLTATNVYDKVTSSVVTFTVKPAHILWIDDHDLGGLSQEFGERKNEWEVALNGYAFEEFDMAANYTASTVVADLLEAKLNGAGSSFNTIIWDEAGTDDYYMMWYSTNGVGTRTPWLFNFLDNGGNAVFIGSNIMGQIYNTDIPAPGDFEDLYMGLDTFQDTIITVTSIDTILVQDPGTGNWYPTYTFHYDTSYRDPWSEDDYVTLDGENGYTSITIDVAKDDGTHQDGVVFPGIAASATVILSDDDTGEPVGYVWTNPVSGGKFVALGMNLYYSPTAEIRAVIDKILMDEFGF
jgi:hypothetical protein